MVSYPLVHYSMELNRVNITQGNKGYCLTAPLHIQEQNESDPGSILKAETPFLIACTFHKVSSSSLCLSLSSTLCEGLDYSIKAHNHVFSILKSQFEGSRHTQNEPFTMDIQVQGQECSACNHTTHILHHIKEGRGEYMNITSRRLSTFIITPIVLAATGGWGLAASVMYKRLASLIADNTGSPYNQVMRMIRRHISFALIDASMMCLRGARSSLHHPKRMNLSDMQSY